MSDDSRPESEPNRPDDPLAAGATSVTAEAAWTPPPSGRLDPRNLPIHELYRRFRQVLLSADRAASPFAVAKAVLTALLDGEGAAPGAVLGGRIYRRSGKSLDLVESVGDAACFPGDRLQASSEAVRAALEKGWVLVGPDGRIGAEAATVASASYALIALGRRRDIVLALCLREAIAPHEISYVLASLQSIADTGVQRRELSQLIDQARAIQVSLLPEDPEVPEGYEIACRTRPAEWVGGDLYDVLVPQPDAFALTIGDAIGHGLPAALLARDVVIGLRMGVEQHLKMVPMVRRLAKVLARSSSNGRFISLFYAELDLDGNLIYVNAGHVPPLVLRADGVGLETLAATGPVLGLDLPGERLHGRSFQKLAPGDLLVLHTDGLSEAVAAGGAELGVGRLARQVAALRERPVREIVDGVFAAVDQFTGGVDPVDDQTLVLLRRL